MSKRAPFTTRTMRLTSADVRDRAIAMLRNVPIDPTKPLELVVREAQKARKPDQNALMFAGPLKDISEQVWLDGRTYSVEVWHSYFKRMGLPSEYDPELCLESYRKYDVDPAGEAVLIGSTTQLTVRGMSEYLEQIYAFGAAHGVQFHTKGEA